MTKSLPIRDRKLESQQTFQELGFMTEVKTEVTVGRSKEANDFISRQNDFRVSNNLL